MTAQVFVVDRSAFFGGRWPQGFVPLAGAEARAFLTAAAGRGRFEPRPVAEATPEWKQWIPYCVLTCGAPDRAAHAAERGVFVVSRTKGQSEVRLHGALSIGIGGHVDPEDATATGAEGATFFRDALARELAEELDADRLELPEPAFLGLLNDDSTEVGRVHAGLVYHLEIPLPLPEARARLQIREISKMRGGFTHLVEFADLWQNRPQFESWSQLLIAAGIAGITGDCREMGRGAQGG